MISKNSLLAGVVIPDARKYSTTSSWPCSDYEVGFSRVLASGETPGIHRSTEKFSVADGYAARYKTRMDRERERERERERGGEGGKRGMPSIRVGISRSSGFATACANKSKVFRKMAVTGLTRMSA